MWNLSFKTRKILKRHYKKSATHAKNAEATNKMSVSSTGDIEEAREYNLDIIKEETMDEEDFLESLTGNNEEISVANLEIIKEETMDETDFLIKELANENEEMEPLGVECNVEFQDETDE